MNRYKVFYINKFKEDKSEICLGKSKKELLEFMGTEERKRVERIELLDEERTPRIWAEQYTRPSTPFYGQAIEYAAMPRKTSMKKHNK